MNTLLPKGLLMPYCSFCGNHKVSDPTKPCKVCEPLLKGPLAKALAVWHKLSESDVRCCGGLNANEDGDHEGPHLFLHCKWWDSCFPDDEEGKSPPVVTVEVGVQLYENHARCYYLYDAENSGGATEYGDTFFLPNPIRVREWKAFYHRLHNGLSYGGECAFLEGWYSCAECGYHASASDPHVHIEEDEL